jgi:hypothetical protein
MTNRARRATELGHEMKAKLWPLPALVRVVDRLRWPLVVLFAAGWLIGFIDLGWVGFAVCLAGLATAPEILAGLYGAIGGALLGRRLRADD